MRTAYLVGAALAVIVTIAAAVVLVDFHTGNLEAAYLACRGVAVSHDTLEEVAAAIAHSDRCWMEVYGQDLTK